MSEAEEVEYNIHQEPQVHFLGATCLLSNPLIICEVLNWAGDNGFILEMSVNCLLPKPTTVLQTPGQQAGSVQPAIMMYFSSNEEDFEAFFGQKYSIEMLSKIPELIRQKHEDESQQENLFKKEENHE